MKIRNFLIATAACGAFVAWSCNKQTPPSNHNGGRGNASTAQSANGKPAALSDNAFKAIITLLDPPAKLRAGQKQAVQVKVKNASDTLWYARGAAFNDSSDTKFILAAGDRWLNAKDETLITDMDGRYGLNRDLKPGEETEVPLLITAPKEPGEYILEVDLVQEQVAWFHDKGSPTARTKVTVVR